MKNRFINILSICVVITLLVSAWYFLIKKDSTPTQYREDVEVEQTKKQNAKTNIGNKSTISQSFVVKKANLLNDIDDNSIPLSLIYELSNYSKEVQNIVKEIAELSNVFLYKISNNNLVLLTENTEDIRHGLEYVEISLKDFETKKFPIIFDLQEEDSLKNIWIYDKNLPKKHTKLNTEGLIEYVEKWNYHPQDEIKYEKLTGENKVVSIKKETVDEHSNLRIEHIFYDEDGNIENSISCSFAGANLVRFTYYNSQKISESFSSFSEYINGRKVKETIYTSDYKVKSIYKATYSDGIRTNLALYDNQNIKIGELLAE